MAKAKATPPPLPMPLAESEPAPSTEPLPEPTPEELRARAIASIVCPYCKPIRFVPDDEPVRGVHQWHHPKCPRGELAGGAWERP